MNLFQVISLIFLIGFSIFKLYGLFSSKRNFLFLFRNLLSLLLVIFAILTISFPSISTYVGNFFGIGRGVDFILYISVLFLYFYVDFLSKKLSDLNFKLRTLVREEALKSYEDPTPYK